MKGVDFEQHTEVQVLTSKTQTLRLEETSQFTEEPSRSKPIVVTGFGPIFSKHNFSETIMQDFYKKHNGKFTEEIDIVTGPDPTPPGGTPKAVETSYDYVKGKKFDDWLRHSDARLYVHLGIKTSDNDTLFFEKQADNWPIKPSGKHGWEVDPKGNYNEGNKCVEGGEDILKTSFDIPALIEQVEEALDPSNDIESPLNHIHLRESHNAGNFLCDFLYYRSLYYAKTERKSANVLFIHVPRRATKTVTSAIVEVLDQVIRCLLKTTTEIDETRQWMEPNQIGQLPSPGLQVEYAEVQITPTKGQTSHSDPTTTFVEYAEISSDAAHGSANEVYATIDVDKAQRLQKHRPGAQSKKHARDARKRRRQKRNARLRNHK